MSDTLMASPALLPVRLTLEQAVLSLSQLRESLRQQSGPEAVLDASALQEMDTSAVAVLLELRRGLLLEGKSLRVLHAPERLRNLVSLYGVQELLPV